MDPLISIIGPVYKVEAYLPQCLDSICGQTYQNLEILLVDDGSPDRCGEICDKYAARDSRIRVLHKQNGGLSDARNAGMQQMSGSYLMFVDSDDMLPPDAVQTLFETALSENAELVIGDHRRFSEMLPEENAKKKTVEVHRLTGSEAMRDMLQNGCAAWARLYQREIHQHIPFPVGEINEDEAIAIQILENCTRVVKTSEVVYYYRCRPESITTSDFAAPKMAWSKHCAENLKYIQAHHPSLEPDAAARYRGSLLWSLTEIALSDQDFTLQVDQLVSQLRKNNTLFQKTDFAFWQDRIRLFILTYFPFWVYKRLLRFKRGI